MKIGVVCDAYSLECGDKIGEVSFSILHNYLNGMIILISLCC